MPVKVVESNLNVLQAAKIRIRNVFANGCKIYLSFSSGKDSLCMANLVYEMILSGELDPNSGQERADDGSFGDEKVL